MLKLTVFYVSMLHFLQLVHKRKAHLHHGLLWYAEKEREWLCFNLYLTMMGYSGGSNAFDDAHEVDLLQRVF